MSKQRRSFLPFKITWLHSPALAVLLTNELTIIAIGMNFACFATTVSHTF